MKRFCFVLSLMLSAVCLADGAGFVSRGSVNPLFRKWARCRSVATTNVTPKVKTAQTAALLSAAENESSESVMRRADGVIPTEHDLSYLTTCNQGGSVDLSISRAEKLPTRYDLREYGLVSSVKNQANTGTCWAHASCGALESWILKVTDGVELDLSENNLANLAGWDLGYNDGGNAIMSTGYFTRWGGPILEKDDPFGTTGKGRPGESTQQLPCYHVHQMRIIPNRVSDDNTAGTHIKRALMTYGALYITYWSCNYKYAENDNYYLTSNAYNTCVNSRAKYGKNSRHASCGGHAVLLVGWDDNYSRKNFATQPPGDGAYLIKNSWGTGIGTKGYMYISYYDCQIARSGNELYAFPSAEPTDNYDKIYQYDPYGWSGGTEWYDAEHNYVIPYDLGFYVSKAYGANIFTATGNDTISAIGFFSRAPNTTVVISVYTGLAAATDPCSGTLAYSQTSTADAAGYFTVPLDKGVTVESGNRFGIVLAIDAPDTYDSDNKRYFPLALEMKGVHNSHATSAVGQSFYSTDGKTWRDVYKDFGESRFNANFCVKAYTATKAAVKSLVGISCCSSDNSTKVASGKSKQFTCKATYSDGTEPTVTPTWEITSGSAYGSISSSGLFTAETVTEEQDVGVKASFTDGGVTKTNGFTVTITVSAPAAPTDLSATEGTESACTRLSWTASSGATAYAIYRAKGRDKASTAASYREDVVGQTKYADKDDAIPGVDYTYFVKAKNGSGTSGFSAGASGWRALAAPESVVASDGTSTEYVRITWSEVKGAGAYRVYRSETGEEEDATPLGDGWQSEIGYDDATAVAGTVYYYWVKAAVDTSGTRPSALGVGDSGIRQKLIVPEKLLIDGAASVTSGGQESYTAKLKFSDGQYVPVTPTWTLNGASTTVASYSYTAPIVSVSTDVLLGAYFTTNGVEYTAAQKITVSPSVPAAPSAPSITSADASGVSLSWTAVAGASSYVIYRGTTTDAASAEKVGTASGTTYTDQGSTPGQTVYYFIAAANTAGTGSRSAASASAMRSLAAPIGVTASNGTYTDKVRVTWSSVLGATHYRVSRATSATGAQTDLGDGWTTETTFDDDTAEAGTAYWYFVRAATSSAGANASVKSAGAKGVCKLVVVPTGLTITGPDRVNASGKAVYAATATFSVGSPAPVAATFSVKSGSGASITEAGSLTADAVTVDAEVVIEASFTQNGETSTATKTVRILAPKAATVSVSNVKATSRWPWSGIIDIDYTIATDPAGKKAAVAVSGFDNDHQKPVAASTLTGDGATGPVAEGEHRISWDLAADHPGFNAANFSVDVSASIASLDAPTGLTASNGTSADAVNLGWNAVDDAETYQVWRGTNTTASAAEKIATVTGTTYADTNATALVTYYYWISAAGSYGESEKSETAVLGTRKLAAPTNVSATNGSSSDQVTVSWTASPSATSYEIWRSTSEDCATAVKMGSTNETVWVDKSVTVRTDYYYWVRAVYNDAVSAFSAYACWSWFVDLMPLRNLLSTIDYIKKHDNFISAKELEYAMKNPILANLDDDTTSISAHEMVILKGVEYLNEDTNRIHDVICGDYSGIPNRTLLFCQCLSDCVKVTKDSKSTPHDDYFDLGLSSPANIVASYASSTRTLSVSWSPVENAAFYELLANGQRYTIYAPATSTQIVTSANIVDLQVRTFEQSPRYGLSSYSATNTALCNADLMSLRNLLSSIDYIKKADGVISDKEMEYAMKNPSLADIDGDTTSISDEEKAILAEIADFYQDKTLITNLFKGDYSDIDVETLIALQRLSDKVKQLKK